MNFVQAKNYTVANRRSVDLIVIHSMEAPEKGDTAENVAAYFAGANAPKASAHFCVDSDSVVQCVKETDVAWHAPGANANGIGIEHAGFARQTREEWCDEYSSAMLELSANLCAALCEKWDVPAVFLDAEDLKKPNPRGITTHKAVTDAFNGGKGHWDPGPGFPMDDYIARVAQLIAMQDGDTPIDLAAYSKATAGIVEANRTDDDTKDT